MQGALYFPFINVPASAWWTRALLYWDEIGTIVPETFVRDPELLDQYTRDLIRADLVRQMLPQDVGFELGENFEGYVHGLPNADLDARRRSFKRGDVVLIHNDKWMSYGSGLREIVHLGLAGPMSGGRGWIAVESRTGAEFMAALVLALCQTEARTNGLRPGRPRTWVPITDSEPALSAMLAGFRPSASGPAATDRVQLRTRADARVVGIRTQLLEDVLPVPEGEAPIDELVRFRSRHGPLLPDLRRHVESLLDDVALIEDADFQFRALGRVAEEVEDMVDAAERYMQEAGIRRISKSPLLRFLKVVPVVGPASADVREAIGSLQTAAAFETKPLAYLACARAVFAPVKRYEIDPRTGRPLVDALEDLDRW